MSAPPPRRARRPGGRRHYLKCARPTPTFNWLTTGKCLPGREEVLREQPRLFRQDLKHPSTFLWGWAWAWACAVHVDELRQRMSAVRSHTMEWKRFGRCRRKEWRPRHQLRGSKKKHPRHVTPSSSTRQSHRAGCRHTSGRIQLSIARKERASNQWLLWCAVFLLASTKLLPRAASMRVFKAWDVREPCEKIQSPRWPFAYFKDEEREHKGRVTSNFQNLGHQCQVRGTQSKCHRCEVFDCEGGTCPLQIQGVNISPCRKTYQPTRTHPGR